jgi:SAF domain
MPAMQRKRSRKVKLNHRLGARRTRALLALGFSLIAIASWYYSSMQEDARGEYLVALADLPSGSVLSESNTSKVRIELAEVKENYLPANQKTLGATLVRSVRSGELISKAMVADPKTQDCVAIRANLGIAKSTEIHLGDQVDLWAAPQNSTDLIPVKIVQAALLLSVEQTEDPLASTQNSVELCVSEAEIRSVVNAIAQKYVVIAVKSK